MHARPTTTDDDAQRVITKRFVTEQVKCILDVVKQIPPDILKAAAKSVRIEPERGWTVALVGEDDDGDMVTRYARRNNNLAPHKYSLLWRDAVGTLHETGEAEDLEDCEPQDIVWWQHSKYDIRAIGPAGEVFPRPEGWLLDGKEINLDNLTVREYTRALALRRFVTPACQAAWELPERLGLRIAALGWEHLPWRAIWRMKSFYETPRDRMTGTKLLHRNLYVAARDPLGNVRCMACDETETQLHLCECPVLHDEFWKPIIKLLTDMGMPEPEDPTIFKATGALSEEKALSKYYAGVWFIAWRCIYAEIVNARVESHSLRTEKALKRCISIIIGRLRAYGLFWKNWVIAGRHSCNPRIIPRKHQEKILLTQDDEGNYCIHEALLAMADELELTSDKP